ncbi:creatininase family protein [Roseiarcus sp.]|uniref:creatininase family protein n=1 Tax=Roseiarcus sp. TaxID=1969460 RepID=UPI003F9E22E6
MLPTRFWAEMTWPDFQRADMSRVVAVLPVAAIEQHGPHLPLGVDAMINEGYVRRAVERLPEDLPVLFLPTQTVGVSGEHAEYPGTLTVSVETAIRAWTEIGDSVARAGCRKLVVMNAHGGNGAAIEAVALNLRMRWRMLAVHASWRRLGYPDDLFSPRDMVHGVHGGCSETSLMLAFRPDLVRAAEARDFPSAADAIERDFALLRAKPPLGFAWAASDLNPSGAVGEANEATAEKGEAAIAFGVERFVSLLRDVHAFDLAALVRGPLAGES